MYPNHQSATFVPQRKIKLQHLFVDLFLFPLNSFLHLNFHAMFSLESLLSQQQKLLNQWKMCLVKRQTAPFIQGVVIGIHYNHPETSGAALKSQGEYWLY